MNGNRKKKPSKLSHRHRHPRQSWISNFTPQIPDSDTGFQIIVSETWIRDFNLQWDSAFLNLYSGFLFPRLRTPEANISRIFKTEKTPFQTLKTRSSKSPKIEIFPKRLTHGFGQKLAILPSFSFQAIQARKMCFTILQNEKRPWLKIRHFSIFFLAIQAIKMCSTIFQIEKTPFRL